MLLKFFQANEQCSFWKNYGECEKTQRYQNCHNWSKKELLSPRTKLSRNKFFFWKFISHRNEKNTNIYKKPVYLGLSLLEISKIVMCKFGMISETKIWRKSKIILHGYRHLYRLHKNRRHLLRHQKRCNWFNKRWFRWENKEEFAVLKVKTYSYLTDNNDEDKKAKDTKKCVVKIKLKFED